MKKDNDEVPGRQGRVYAGLKCMPAGVPGFMGYGGPNPPNFLQNPKEVWIIHSEQVRRIYMDVAAFGNPKPSWYGESSAIMRGHACRRPRSARLTSHSLTFTVRPPPGSSTS